MVYNQDGNKTREDSMNKTDDTKIINDKPSEDFFCTAVEDLDDSTQISALLLMIFG
jgi:hypothetical protein